MRIDASRLVRFGTTNVNPLRRAAADVEVQIGVSLLGGRLAPVAFGVGHGSADDVVVHLHLLDELLESRMVRSGIFLIDLVSHRVQRIERVHPDAALETGTC